jgi:Metallo-peptidase family M12/Secretion system C-terminal sorting domain/Fibronectin type III domain/Reprolysin family propeptide
MRLTASIRAFIIIVCAYLSQTNSSAQNQNHPIAQLIEQQHEAGVVFQHFNVLKKSTKRHPEAARITPNAQFLMIQPADLTQLVMMQVPTIEFELPYHNETLILELAKTELAAEGFIVTDEREKSIAITPGVHYRGVVQGDPASLVTLSVFDGELMGMISNDRHGNLVLGRINEPDNRSEYILYSDIEMTVKSPFSCAVIDPDDDVITIDHHHGDMPESVVNGCVRVFLEADHELFVEKGSVQNTVNYLMGAWNQVAALYTVEQINITISQILVWTTPDTYSTSSSAAALNQFQTFRTSFNGDLAHLVGTGGNNLGGIAYLDVLCVNSYRYAFSDITGSYNTVPTYSWTVEVMTHEMGHNLGSNHTQWCGWSGGPIDGCFTPEGGCAPGPAPTNGGTIMSYCHLTSYGINFNHGFGPQPGNRIRSEVGGATCLAATCTPASSCGAPTDLNVNNITGNGATLTWSAVSGATSYTLRYRTVGTATWTVLDNATSPVSITGLPANDEIEVTLQAVCGGTASATHGLLFVTGASGGGGGGSTCSSPSGLTGTPASGTINTIWSAVSGAASYGIQWKPASSANWGALTTIATPNYLITGLAAGTAYDIRVQTNCTNGVVSSFSQIAVTTISNSTCSAPTGLSGNPSTSTINAAWNAASGAGSYAIQWKPSSSGNWGALTTTSTPNYLITGLASGTSYDVRVQTNCTNNSTSAFIQTTVSTSTNTNCAAPPALTGTATSSTINANWGSVSGMASYGIQWKQSSASAWNTIVTTNNTNYSIQGLLAGTSYDVRVQTNCTNGATSAFSQITVLTASSASCGTPVNLTGTALTTSINTSWGGVSGATAYGIQWKTAASGTWGPLYSVTTPGFNINGLTAGTTYDIRVSATCTSGVTSPFAQITVTTTGGTGCGAPTNFNGVPTTNSISTTWGGVSGATSYSIQWKPTSGTLWSTLVATSGNSYQVTGLTAATSYNIRVRTNCSGGTASAFVQTTVTTIAPPSCGTPTNLTGNPTTTSINTAWSGVSGAASYSLQWKPTSSGTWGALVTTSATNYGITGLTSGTSYDIRVRTNCVSGAASSFVTIMVSTSVSGGACATPNTPTITNLTATSAMVNWGAVTGASSYSLRVKRATSTTWFTFNGLPGTNVTVQGLAPGTAYQAQVRTNCSNGTASAYSGIVNFTTPINQPFADGAQTDLSDDSSIRLEPKFTVMPNPAQERVQIGVELVETSDVQINIMDTYGRVVATHAAHMNADNVEMYLNSLAPGIYFVQVRINDAPPLEVQRLMKL